MRSIIPGNSSAGSTSAANYAFIHLVGDPTGLGMWNATEANRRSIVSHNLTLSKLYVKLTTAPGVGKSWTYTVYKNGSPTAITLTISDTAVSGADNVNTVDVSAGDTISLEQVPSGTPTSTGPVAWALQQEADDLQDCLFGRADNLSNSAARYIPPTYTGWLTAAPLTPMPTAGVFKNLFIALSGSPGAGTSYTFELYKNGSPTGVQVVIADSDTTGSNTVNTASFSAGDVVYLVCTPSGTPTVRTATGAISFDPTTDGESVEFARIASPSNSSTVYNPPFGASYGVWLASESGRKMQMNGCKIKNLYMSLESAPGASTSLQFSIRKNGASEGPTITISGTDTTGNNNTTVEFAQGDEISMESVPTNTPTVSIVHTGMTLFIGDYQESLSDSSTPTDAVSKAVGKSFSGFGHLVATSDARVKAIGKISSDSATASDDNAKAVGKVVSDSDAPTDLASLGVGKSFGDSVTPSDSFVKTIGKVLSDAVTAIDATVKAVGKFLADVATASDSESHGSPLTRFTVIIRRVKTSFTLRATDKSITVNLPRNSDSIELRK